MSRDLLVLVPGFLGFETFGTLSYFGTRLSLAEDLQRVLDVEIEVAATAPGGPLAARQQLLLQQLRAWDGAHAPERIHFLGHSAGGVDVELLTRERPLAGTWGEDERLRGKLRTVLTCSSPMAGTWLAASELGEFVRALGREGILTSLGRRGADDAAWLWLSAALAAATNPAVTTLLVSLFADLGRALPFVSSLWRHRELIAELHPDALRALYDHVGPRALPVHRHSVVTVAPPPQGRRPTLYAALDHALRSATPAPDAEVLRRVIRLEGAAGAAITAGWRPSFDAASNDGVVTSALQWVTGDPILLVVADHADILGEASPGAGGVFGGLLESEARYGAPEAQLLRSHIVRWITRAAADGRPFAQSS